MNLVKNVWLFFEILGSLCPSTPTGCFFLGVSGNIFRKPELLHLIGNPNRMLDRWLKYLVNWHLKKIVANLTLFRLFISQFLFTIFLFIFIKCPDSEVEKKILMFSKEMKLSGKSNLISRHRKRRNSIEKWPIKKHYKGRKSGDRVNRLRMEGEGVDIALFHSFTI